MLMVRPDPNKKRYVLGILYFAGVILLSVLFISKLDLLLRFQQYGYLGLLGMTVVTTFSWPLPLPYMILAFTMGSVLNPVLVGLVAGGGLTIGGVILYYTGCGGRRFMPRIDLSGAENGSSDSKLARFLRRVRANKILDLAQRRGELAVFVTSAFPNPFFVPLAVSMGTMRFRLVKFVFACLAGQVAKMIVIAYLGYFGLGSFLRWWGIVPPS